MVAALLQETLPKLFTSETLRTAAKQSERIHFVPLRLRRAIKRFLRDPERTAHMHRKVLRLSASLCQIKAVNLQLVASTSRELVEDPFKSMDRSQRWKISSAYGDAGLKYMDDETIAYVASRMPAVYSACYRVLREVRRRLPGFSPTKVLDFGAGTGSAFWALREVWPRSIERVNIVEPSKAMQRACQSLLQGIKGLPLMHSYDSLQALSKAIGKEERGHDLVIASYVLGEIPSLKDRITVARQLWDLTRDVLVLVEPGTPHGFNIISQMRSHILWMEKRVRLSSLCVLSFKPCMTFTLWFLLLAYFCMITKKCRKLGPTVHDPSKELVSADEKALAINRGAFVVAPCAHDGVCPLEKSGKYCHFVQRLERTSLQRAYKRSKGKPLRGFEDEKFCFVVLRRGERPMTNWPLDGMNFETLKERHAKRKPEDLEIDYEDQFLSDGNQEIIPYEEGPSYVSDITEVDTDNDTEEIEDVVNTGADTGGGWGRIIFTPLRRGKRVEMDVCRSTKRDGSEGCFERIVVTQRQNPSLHLQARRSLWGDLWPC